MQSWVIKCKIGQVHLWDRLGADLDQKRFLVLM